MSSHAHVTRLLAAILPGLWFLIDPLSATTRTRPAVDAFAGRFVAMVSPVAGETFSAPATLRLIAAAHDPNVFINSPRDGLGGNAAKVQFFVDEALVLEVDGSRADYFVFKGFVNGIAAGRRRAWARAIYTNPPEVLDSAPMVIDVAAPPPYGKIVNLQHDLTVPGAGLELVGTPESRIRVNGNGHRIVSALDGSGPVVVRYVDFFDLGDRIATSVPGLDLTTRAGLIIENCIFDSSNPLRLVLEGTAPGRVRGNTWRSNMRQPLGQNPDGRGNGSFPVVVFRGASSGPKVVQGNNVGAGWLLFESTRGWLVGGDDAASDGNVLIGPRTGIFVDRSHDIQLRRNYSHHIYFGGWSQGSNFELGGGSSVTAEHNVIIGGSWPVRGVGGEFGYNLVLDGGHQWLWADHNGASVHHNVFVGGANDVGGIYVPYRVANVRIAHNTIDLGAGSRGTAVRIAAGDVSLTSNVFLNASAPAVRIEGGTLAADYNLFWRMPPTVYSDGRMPAHDSNGDPRMPGSSGAGFAFDPSLLWMRRSSSQDVLEHYRSLYRPGPGSAAIGRGDPSGGSGTTIGAISGTAGRDDRF